MITVLYGNGQERIATDIAASLVAAFNGNVEVVATPASAPSPWPAEVNWDDLLLVVFDGEPFPDTGKNYIANYLQERKQHGLILPLAVDLDRKHPPGLAEATKALELNAAAMGVNGGLVKRVGAMLGLRVQQRDNKIFISYRASDGTAIAEQIEQHLKNLGYPVWRDEARELDGDTKILPGTEVQQQIDEALDDANVVLLLDTPAAPHSIWIKHEVDTANGLLLPILPLVFRVNNDSKQGPRFPALVHLQRWVSLSFLNPRPTPPLNDDELNRITDQMELYLCEMFQRKCRIPFLVEKEFVSRDFTWRLLDRRFLMSEALKKHSERLSTKVLSHCSIFDQVHGPTLKKFSAFLKSTGRPNHSLYIYDGELIPEPQLKEIIETTPPEDGVVILHHQELAALIDSNFTTF
jgi:hypothetical protein